MYNPQTKFSHILSPVKTEDFFSSHFGRKPLHIPGNSEKFSGLFTWDDANRILNTAKGWSASTFKMILDNESIPPAEFMPQGTPDLKKVSSYTEQGASIVLSGMETQSEGVAALAASLQSVIGGYAQCNLYCSFKQHPGFLPHFDLMDVFVIQIEGEKDWDIYETQFDNPILKPGYHQMSFSREQHAENKGGVEKHLTLTPGDVLYIPKGKYHAALATSDQSLHLTFGMEPPRALDFVQTAVDGMFTETALREELPHFDNEAEYARKLDEIADLVHARLKSAEAKATFREQHRLLAMQNVQRFHLPANAIGEVFRVRTRDSRMKRRGKNWQLISGDRDMELAPENADLVKWMLDSEFFERQELLAQFADYGEHNCDTLIKLMLEFGLISAL